VGAVPRLAHPSVNLATIEGRTRRQPWLGRPLWSAADARDVPGLPRHDAEVARLDWIGFMWPNNSGRSALSRSRRCWYETNMAFQPNLSKGGSLG
jgi:hypothetical protein